MDKTGQTQVIGIASGKGGVGKTTVSVNLAVALQALGKRVMLFDADMGLANAQIALGARAEYNLGHHAPRCALGAWQFRAARNGRFGRHGRSAHRASL